MESKAIPFWRRWDWQKWRRQYIQKIPEPERRAWVRYPGNPNTVCQTAADGVPMAARVRNISLGGINLVLSEPFPSGTVLRIEVPNPLDASPRVLWARVLHAVREADGQWSLGCAFTQQIGPDTLRDLRADGPRPPVPEARAAVRHPCDLPLSCRLAGADSTVWPGRLRDLSEIGLGMVVGCPVRSGATVVVEVVPRHGRPPLRMAATVVHARPIGDGAWMVGCSLARPLTPDELRTLLA